MSRLTQFMDMRGGRVLITGATGHLGEVFAETFAELGADLVLVDRPGSAFDDLQERVSDKWHVNVVSVACDMEFEEERVTMIERVKRDSLSLSCLVNNAAFGGTSNLQGWTTPFEEQTLESWRRALEVNLSAIFHLCQAFTPELRASKNGNIINIGSIYGEFGPDWSLYGGTEMGNPAAYSASKGGLIQLTRWLATTLAPDVRVNAISPGGVFRGQPEQFVDRYVSKTPMGRMATEDDLRGAVAYLATRLSSYVTGQTLRVDGGWSIW
jgi:NAD(P)-dependent dehydrogenase (short-subunit alcohol dehydrogenase family)